MLLLTVVATAGDITISQAIDKTEVAFEDSVKFEITMQWPGPQTAFLFEKAVRPDFDRFKVGNFSSTVSTTGEGADQVTTKKLVYTLVPQLPGLSEIKPLTIEYITWPDSTTGQLVTEPMAVTIYEPTRKPTPEQSSSTGLVIGLVFLGIVIAGVAVYLLMVRKRRPQEPVKSPAEQFVEGLDALKDKSGNDLKQFQTGLYGLLVTFAASQYDLTLSGMAGQQVSDAITGKESRALVSEALSGWLLEAERQKFSPVEAAPGEVLRLAADIRTFFEKNFLK